MQGLMMNRHLLVSDLLEHAAAQHGQQSIISRSVEGPIVRHTYAQIAQRSRQLAQALLALGAGPGDRIGTLAWNTHRHFEAYYAISGIGAITHTINPRLFPEQLRYIINHADDRILLVDLSFIPLLRQLLPQLPGVEHIILMTDYEQQSLQAPDWLCYETLLAEQSPNFSWPRFSDEQASALCYTSGTTGNPKGVLYSHYSTLLHAMAACRADALGITPESCVLPVVPMFHVCAWGVPYAAAMMGSRLILPGAALDGASLTELIQQEQADLLLGVPTVWMGLLRHLHENHIRLQHVKRVVVGGSAAPLSMIREFDENHSAFVVHAWGMTELSPLGTVNLPTPEIMRLPPLERYQHQLKQGRPVFGIELAIFDDKNHRLAHDGKTFGHLRVRGPWVAERYFRHEELSAFEHGWFDTGDIATLDEAGYMQIVDRAKDVIKSGGEWISSIDLENAAMSYSGLREACVIGIPHPRWDERPLLLVVPGHEDLDLAALRDHLAAHVARWWLPDSIVVVAELPHTATGKLSKLQLRNQYHDYYLKPEQNRP